MDRKVLIRKVIVYAVYILLLTSFQVTFPGAISFRGQIADLMFVFVVMTGYFFGFADGAVVGLITGLFRDYFAGPAFIGLDGKTARTVGIGMLVLFLAAAVSSSFFTRRMHRNLTFAFLATAACTLIYKISGHIIASLWTSATSSNSYGLSVGTIITDSILPQLMLNLIITVPMIFLLRFAGPYKKGVNPYLDKEEIGGNTWLTI